VSFTLFHLPSSLGPVISSLFPRPSSHFLASLFPSSALPCSELLKGLAIITDAACEAIPEVSTFPVAPAAPSPIAVVLCAIDAIAKGAYTQGRTLFSFHFILFCFPFSHKPHEIQLSTSQILKCQLKR